MEPKLSPVILDRSRLEMKAYQKAYYQKHRKWISARNKAHYRANPEKAMSDCRKRKALKLGNKHEPYKKDYIFERDGWICQICGDRINRRLKWPHPRSKSLDHIVPLSKGGDDSPVNVQASHLRCNVGKLAKNRGQLRLFG